MKTLILVRHAKSDWPEDTEDFDRPLAEKGIADARKMAIWLHDQHIQIDKMVTSPALRALETCKIFNSEFETEIETAPKLYNPTEAGFEAAIYHLSDDVDSVALFSHNNGISNFANSLTDEIFIFPTCGIAAFQLDCDTWGDLEIAEKKKLFFVEPKNV